MPTAETGMEEKGEVAPISTSAVGPVVPAIPQDIELWDENDNKAELWILSVLSQIPRSIYNGGGDLEPRKAGGDVSLRDKKKEAGDKNLNSQRQKKKRPVRTDSSSKPDGGSGFEDDGDKDGDAAAPGKVKREELRKRLHQKLAQHQRDRKAVGNKSDEKKETPDPKQSRALQKSRSNKGRKKGQRSDMEVDTTSKNDNETKSGKSGGEVKSKAKAKTKGKQLETKNPRKRVMPSDAMDEKEDVKITDGNSTVEINRIVVPGEDEKGGVQRGRAKKRRKLSEGKLKELQRQLAAASKEQELKNRAGDIQKADATGDLGSVKDTVKQREIEKALQRVKGERPKDNVSKIRKSIRVEKRKKEKSKEEWAKRVEALEKEKEERQERRERNLKERRDAIKASGKRSKKGGRKSKSKGKARRGDKRG